MGRRNRRREDDLRPLGGGFGNRRTVGDYVVQGITGAQASKEYICPGCNQRIAIGVAHVVAWPDHEGPDGRRHWHTPCFNRQTR